MDRRKVKIVDRLFSHVDYSTLFQESKYIVWDRSNIIPDDDIVIYTDYSLQSVTNNIKGITVAWLLESPVVTPTAYSWIKDNHDKFDMVLTHNKELLDISDRFKFSPTAGCWIKPEDQKIYDKTKLFSTITSAKQQYVGHRLRHEIVKNIKGIDVFGRGYKPIDNKIEGLKDYMFSFAIENVKTDYYFTEKLIDCFVTGTVPIYWGCPSIGNYFNTEGMIIFDTIDEIKEMIEDLTQEKYESMKPHIEDNFERSKEFLMSEDYFWKKYFL